MLPRNGTFQNGIGICIPGIEFLRYWEGELQAEIPWGGLQDFGGFSRRESLSRPTETLLSISSVVCPIQISQAKQYRTLINAFA
jgi:hypothetical protein